MKKVSVFLLSIISFGAFAQQKKITFSKKLEYKMHQSVPTRALVPESDSKITMLTNNVESLVLLNLSTYVGGYMFVDSDGVSNVNVSFNNVLEPNFNNPFVFAGIYRDEDETSEQKLSLIPLNIKETILGYPCDQYLLKTIFVDPSRKGDEDNLQVCINTTSGINNIPSIAQIFKTQYGVEAIGELKGLLLKAAPSKSYEKDYVQLEKIADTKDFVYFNNKANLENQAKYITEAKAKLAVNQKERSSLVDSTAVDLSFSMDMYQDEVDGLDTYFSSYRKPTEGDLVIDNISKESKFWSILPNHCKTIDKDLTVFDNEILKKRLRNYVGQLCDLYLMQSESNTVGVKSTVDELRRENLYLFNSMNDFSKKDQKKLKEYLNKLD